MGYLRKKLAEFATELSGNMAITAALTLPALVAAGAVGIEMAQINGHQSKLQSLADTAAVAAARELRLGNATEETIIGVARNHVAAASAGLNLAYEFNGGVAANKQSVTVTLNASTPAGLGAAAGLTATHVSASATARVIGGAPVCAIGLNETDGNTIYLEQAARMQAPKCAVYSNSRDRAGLALKDGAQLTAAFICSAGGYRGGPTAYSPSPDSDCPVFPDPLASRPSPAIGCCDFGKKDLEISGLTYYLSPGTYCGGITIDKGTAVILQPGLYVIKDGPLVVAKGSSLSGEDVSLFFTGIGAAMDMKKDSVISLKAPRTGPMAGMLMFQDRATAVDNVKFEISSDGAATLLGTIYLPRGRLFLGGDKPVAQSSAYTIVVANKIDLSAGPTMVLNTDYASTEVPVPQGVGPLSNEIALQR